MMHLSCLVNLEQLSLVNNPCVLTNSSWRLYPSGCWLKSCWYIDNCVRLQVSVINFTKLFNMFPVNLGKNLYLNWSTESSVRLPYFCIRTSTFFSLVKILLNCQLIYSCCYMNNYVISIISLTVSREINYRPYLVYCCPNLRNLDGCLVTNQER